MITGSLMSAEEEERLARLDKRIVHLEKRYIEPRMEDDSRFEKIYSNIFLINIIFHAFIISLPIIIFPHPLLLIPVPFFLVASAWWGPSSSKWIARKIYERKYPQKRIAPSIRVSDYDLQEEEVARELEDFDRRLRNDSL